MPRKIAMRLIRLESDKHQPCKRYATIEMSTLCFNHTRLCIMHLLLTFCVHYVTVIIAAFTTSILCTRCSFNHSCIYFITFNVHAHSRSLSPLSFPREIGETELCTCGTAPMTAEHLLQECPSYDNERSETWEQAVTLQDKLRRCREPRTDHQLFQTYKCHCLSSER
jgi:hypothetical protein